MNVADLYTLSVVGLILGTFIFSTVADFFGRKLSFYIGCATCIVFSLCMVPPAITIIYLLSSRLPQPSECCHCFSLQ